MSCYQFLAGGIAAIVAGTLLVIYSDKVRSSTQPAGNVSIKVGGGLLLMIGILTLIGSVVGFASGCSPQSIV